MSSQRKTKKKIWGSFVATIGFILSPLALWNDMIINVPLAFVFAYVSGLALSAFISVNVWGFLALLGIGYFLTNVIGFFLLHRGASHISDKVADSYQFSWLKCIGYTVGALAVVGILTKVGILEFGDTEKLMASVLKVYYLK